MIWYSTRDSPPVLLQSKIEVEHPSVDFSLSYRLSRLFGLTPDQKSFLLKFLQNILPTRERLHRCGKAPSPACLFCDVQVDTLDHVLACPQSEEVATPLLASLSSQVDHLTVQDIMVLNIKTTESWELPAAWLLSVCLTYIWEQRMSGKPAKLEACRAELLAKIALLRCTRWKHYSLQNSALLLDETINVENKNDLNQNILLVK